MPPSFKTITKTIGTIFPRVRIRAWRRALVTAIIGMYGLLWLFALTNTCSRSEEEMPQYMFDRTFTDNTEDGRCRLEEEQLRSVKVDVRSSKNMTQIEAGVQNVQLGGSWKPTDCKPWQNVAVIVPYRERYDQLKLLLQRLHPMLQKQKVHYTIYVAEQAGDAAYNKGKLMNIAFLEALKDNKYDCFIFHDVDLLPEHDRNIYYCNNAARHLSPAIDESRYHLMFCEIMGGVVALSRHNFIKVNGYPMVYLTWGAEDDDFAARTEAAGLMISRPPNHIGRYKMVKHEKRNKLGIRYDAFLQWRRRWKVDGVTNLQPEDYNLLSRERKQLFTHLMIDVGDPPSIPPVVKNAPQESIWWFLGHFFP